MSNFLLKKKKKLIRKKVMPTDRTYFFGDVSGNEEHFLCIVGFSSCIEFRFLICICLLYSNCLNVSNTKGHSFLSALNKRRSLDQCLNH